MLMTVAFFSIMESKISDTVSFINDSISVGRFIGGLVGARVSQRGGSCEEVIGLRVWPSPLAGAVAYFL